MKVAIVGAGPAGVTAAHQLSLAGVPVTIFEKEKQVGGLSRTIELWGQKVDLGPHRFFTTYSQVKEQWFRAVADDCSLINRQTRIFYSGRFFDYPLRPTNVLKNLGVIDSALCFLSYCRQHIPFHQSGEVTFESWVSERFGHQLYQKFFKTYSEKLWGIPCTDLDADFAVQRIRSFSLWEALKAAVTVRGGGHRTLVDEFAYPKGGAGMVYEQMASEIVREGGTLRTDCPVDAIVRDGNTVCGIRLPSGDFEPFEHVISTMDMPSLLRGFHPLPDDVADAISKLSFRNTIIVYLHVGSSELFPDQWIYVHSPNLHVGRITNFRNWAPELYGDHQSSIVALEYWCYDRDVAWEMPDIELVQTATDEIRSSGLLGNAHILDGYVVRIKGSYPVYRTGYKDALRPIIHFLSGIRGLSVIGRSGTFKYNNQDHSILMGILAAENLLHGTSHDLWSVNTDCEYQESGAGFSESELPGLADEHSLRGKHWSS